MRKKEKLCTATAPTLVTNFFSVQAILGSQTLFFPIFCPQSGVLEKCFVSIVVYDWLNDLRNTFVIEV